MTFPDRMSAASSSPHYRPDLVWKAVVHLDGERVDRCVEYCISEGWVTVAGEHKPGQREQTRSILRGVVSVQERSEP